MNKTVSIAVAMALVFALAGGAQATWTSTDIGGPGLAGSSTGTPPTVTVIGGGADIWGTADQFHYAYDDVTVSGDFAAAARIVSQGNTNDWAKAGIMARETLGAGSRHVHTSATIGQGVTQQWRDATGGGSGWPNTRIPESPNSSGQPYYLYLERVGNDFYSAWATDTGGGTHGAWSAAQKHTSGAMPSDVLLGLSVTSHNNGALSTVVFDNIDFNAAPMALPVARLTAPSNPRDGAVIGGAYAQAFGGAVTAPMSWTIELAGAPVTVDGIRETIWDAALPNGDVTGNIENVRAAIGSLGPKDAQGLLTSHLHYNNDAAVSARAAALGAVGFDAGNFTMLWVTDFTPDQSGDWGFRNNNVDDRYSFWIDLDQDGVFQPNERFWERTSCCAGSGDRFISMADSLIDSLIADETYLLGLVMNDTGGGGYFRDMEFLSPSGSWTDLNPGAAGQAGLWTTTDATWTTLASGTGQVGDDVSDGLFGVTLGLGTHHLRLTVEADGGAPAVAELTVTVIPEPLTMLAVGLSVTGLGGYIRKRRRR